MGSGWKGSNRSTTLPTDWPRTQRRILERDGHRCQVVIGPGGRRCLAPARQVDHEIPAHLGGSDDDGNLSAICDPHHAAKSSAEGNARRWAGRHRPTEPHPGAIR